MRPVIQILFIILGLILFTPYPAAAGLFAPNDNGAMMGSGGEPWTDNDNDGEVDAGEYVDINNNGQWDEGYVPDVRNMTYSATWDAAFPNVVCLYNRLPQLNGDPPELLINKFFITDTAKSIIWNRKARCMPFAR